MAKNVAWHLYVLFMGDLVVLASRNIVSFDFFAVHAVFAAILIMNLKKKNKKTIVFFYFRMLVVFILSVNVFTLVH